MSLINKALIIIVAAFTVVAAAIMRSLSTRDHAITQGDGRGTTPSSASSLYQGRFIGAMGHRARHSSSGFAIIPKACWCTDSPLDPKVYFISGLPGGGAARFLLSPASSPS
jgi:hypothetical protein